MCSFKFFYPSVVYLPLNTKLGTKRKLYGRPLYVKCLRTWNNMTVSQKEL